MQTGRQYLQQLMEKCGNRYCVFNNKNMSDCRQVIKLLETIEAMMRENGGAHYTFDQYQRILPSITETEQRMKEERNQKKRERREKVAELQEEKRKHIEQLEEKTRLLERKHNKLERLIADVDHYYRAGPVDWREEMRKHINSEEMCGSAAAAGSSQLGQESSSEIRILLTGVRRAGKSSSGNTILGREAFHTEEEDPYCESTKRCDARKGEVAGRHISIVDTSDLFDEEGEKELMIQFSARSPHAVILVISLEMLTDRLINSDDDEMYGCQERLQELYGEAVLKHSVILFTYGDRLGGLTVEQYIEKEDEEGRKRFQWLTAKLQQLEEERMQKGRAYLQQLMEKCGNRYCVFNNKNMSDRRQVIKLLETIEAMMRENGGAHYTFDQYQSILPLGAEQRLVEERKWERRKMLDPLEEEKRRVTKKLEEMSWELKKERNDLQEKINEVHRYYNSKPLDIRKQIRKLIRKRICSGVQVKSKLHLSHFTSMSIKQTIRIRMWNCNGVQFDSESESNS
ncbi:GTPase IMAP family member 7 [Amia ocellicauda]|uniref:GTPase IMAP family member 7 n=1 Tax=Amia ocellicauda TaxID=2972642 RepID=UPI0034638780